ncbi:MAG: glycosyltransferase, partial [Lysobacterales bacterium]
EQELRAEQERHARLTTELQQTLENTLAGLQHVQSELELKHQELQAAQTDLQHERADLHSTLVQLSRLQANYRLLTQTLDDLRASASWRVTAPFRAVRRTAANLMLARAWNPLRWPWLAANMIRNLHGLGFAGTLHRMQASRAEDMPAPTRMADSLPPAPDAAIPGQAPAHFPRHQSPDASIVIPVYNQWTYTAACLASLRSARSRHTFEVIVVDDQSSDETSAELAGIHGITTLRNEENLGFLGSCNRGAWHARGRFLVLLNNDTQVTDGWLDELVDTFTAQPEAGLVGARLVYPDGRLQESGGIIYNDASGWNYGRDDVADRPEYEFLREADYVSGACIALRTSLFRELGGLDERYAPAYYEDTDLAFRIRGAGLKVFVQPSSVVVHHEGITSGTDTSSGTKRFQVINRQKFLERWQAELANQPEPITDHSDPVPVRRATRHRQAGRVLFIDAFTPKPDRDSGSLRLLNLMRLCKDMGYGVTFLPDNLAYADRYTRVLQKAGIEALYNPWIVSLDEYFAARGGEFDFIVISRYYVASNYVALLRRLCPNASFIFDTVDLHYLRERRQAEFEGSTALKFAARQTRRAELAVIREADATLVVSPDEQALLAEDAPGSEVHLVSNIHEVPGRNGEFADRNDIYFVGAYRHPPNVDAACWFVNEIWPLVRAELPGVRFHLIGNDAPDEVRSLQGDGVVFHGYVESLQPFLDGCRLAVAPLRFGAGVKGKVNMSMAHGQPVVATPIAAEGLFVEHEKECLLAGDAESFAREVIRLYQDEALWRKLSDASARNVEEHFSMAAARDRLAALFDALAVQQGVSAD